MDNTSKVFARLAYAYIALPILIFFIGWCNPVVAVLGSIIILISFYFTCKNAPEMWIPTNKKQWFLLILLGVIALIWVYSSGIGALVYQNEDHNCRNPIFELLVKNSWPVISSYKENIFANTSTPIVMTYYIGFWMVPALVGKMFNSILAGYYAQIVWATIGVFLVFYYVLSFLKNKNIFPAVVFVVFSGLDIVGALLFHRYDLLTLTSHLEWWVTVYDFGSFTTQLFWVFNQALPAWIVTLMLLREKDNKNILFLYSCLLIHATLPSIGLLPIVVYLMLKNGNSPSRRWFTIDYVKNALKSALTLQNTVGAITVFAVSYLYLSQNIAGGNVTVNSTFLIELVFFFVLCFPVEVGIYLLLIWKYNTRNPLLYIIALCLFLLPSIKVGYSIDFGTRAIIPSLVILYLFVVKTLDEGEIKKDKLITFLLIFSLLLGSMTPIHEFLRTFHYTRKGVTKIAPKLSVANFFAYVDGNRFLKYVGKKTKERRF